MKGINVQVKEGLIDINIDTKVAIDVKAMMKMQRQGGWDQGLNQVVSRLLDPMLLEIQQELERTLHQAIIRGEIDYKAAI